MIYFEFGTGVLNVPLLCFLRNFLDVATGSHYAVTGRELMHTNDCAIKVYL